MLIYLAGSLFPEAARCFNLGLAQRLEALSLHVFLPRRDGVERDKPPYETMTDPRGAAAPHVPPRQGQDP
jgi:nucleoside 2-deoxyribosyltransferase